MSLTEEEEDAEILVVPHLLDDHLATQNKHWIHVEVLMDKPFNKEAFKLTVHRAWKPIHPLVFRELGSMVFLADFLDERDKEYVIHESPWSFDKNPVLTKELEGTLQVSQVKFMQALLWVRLHD